MLLAIDTTTRFAGIALYNEDGLRLEQLWETGNNHTVELIPYIVRACEEQAVNPTDLQAVAVALGPGSFTGLRVGLSVAKGLALALRIPVLGVPSLDAAAYAHRRDPLPVCAVLPAGRARWCVGFYEVIDGQWQRCGDYLLAAVPEIASRLMRPTLLCGEITNELAQILTASVPDNAVVAGPAAAVRRTGYVAELAWQRYTRGEQDDLSTLAPIYLQHA